MADSPLFSFPLFLMFSFLLHIAVSADPPQISPTPSPLSPSPLASSPSPLASSPSPSLLSPHLPSATSPLAPSPLAPTPANDGPASSPSPAPADSSIVNHNGVTDAQDKADSSSGGMNAGKKAGVTIGVIVAAGVVVLAAVVYKKRQQNIRRAQYGYAARREFL